MAPRKKKTAFDLQNAKTCICNAVRGSVADVAAGLESEILWFDDQMAAGLEVLKDDTSKKEFDFLPKTPSRKAVDKTRKAAKDKVSRVDKADLATKMMFEDEEKAVLERHNSADSVISGIDFEEDQPRRGRKASKAASTRIKNQIDFEKNNKKLRRPEGVVSGTVNIADVMQSALGQASEQSKSKERAQTRVRALKNKILPSSSEEEVEVTILDMPSVSDPVVVVSGADESAELLVSRSTPRRSSSIQRGGEPVARASRSRISSHEPLAEVEAPAPSPKHIRGVSEAGQTSVNIQAVEVYEEAPPSVHAKAKKKGKQTKAAVEHTSIEEAQPPTILKKEERFSKEKTSKSQTVVKSVPAVEEMAGIAPPTTESPGKSSRNSEKIRAMVDSPPRRGSNLSQSANLDPERGRRATRSSKSSREASLETFTKPTSRRGTKNQESLRAPTPDSGIGSSVTNKDHTKSENGANEAQDANGEKEKNKRGKVNTKVIVSVEKFVPTNDESSKPLQPAEESHSPTLFDTSDPGVPPTGKTRSKVVAAIARQEAVDLLEKSSEDPVTTEVAPVPVHVEGLQPAGKKRNNKAVTKALEAGPTKGDVKLSLPPPVLVLATPQDPDQTGIVDSSEADEESFANLKRRSARLVRPDDVVLQTKPKDSADLREKAERPSETSKVRDHAEEVVPEKAEKNRNRSVGQAVSPPSVTGERINSNEDFFSEAVVEIPQGKEKGSKRTRVHRKPENEELRATVDEETPGPTEIGIEGNEGSEEAVPEPKQVEKKRTRAVKKVVAPPTDPEEPLSERKKGVDEETPGPTEMPNGIKANDGSEEAVPEPKQVEKKRTRAVKKVVAPPTDPEETLSERKKSIVDVFSEVVMEAPHEQDKGSKRTRVLVKPVHDELPVIAAEETAQKRTRIIKKATTEIGSVSESHPPFDFVAPLPASLSTEDLPRFPPKPKTRLVHKKVAQQSAENQPDPEVSKDEIQVTSGVESQTDGLASSVFLVPSLPVIPPKPRTRRKLGNGQVAGEGRMRTRMKAPQATITEDEEDPKAPTEPQLQEPTVGEQVKESMSSPKPQPSVEDEEQAKPKRTRVKVQPVVAPVEEPANLVEEEPAKGKRTRVKVQPVVDSVEESTDLLEEEPARGKRTRVIPQTVVIPVEVPSNLVEEEPVNGKRTRQQKPEALVEEEPTRKRTKNHKTASAHGFKIPVIDEPEEILPQSPVIAKTRLKLNVACTPPKPVKSPRQILAAAAKKIYSPKPVFSNSPHKPLSVKQKATAFEKGDRIEEEDEGKKRRSGRMTPNAKMAKKLLKMALKSSLSRSFMEQTVREENKERAENTKRKSDEASEGETSSKKPKTPSPKTTTQSMSRIPFSSSGKVLGTGGSSVKAPTRFARAPLLSASKAKPTNIVTGVQSFLPSNPVPPKPAVDEVKRKKEEEFKEKQAREAEALRKKEEENRRKAEEAKRKREEKAKEVLLRREMMSKADDDKAEKLKEKDIKMQKVFEMQKLKSAAENEARKAKQRELEEKRLAEEKAKLKKRKDEEVIQDQSQKKVPGSALKKLNATYNNESPVGYVITPDPKKKVDFLVDPNNYNINDLDSGDETDDDDAPRKPIPSWATGRALREQLNKQALAPPEMREVFPPDELLILPPDLAKIFPIQRRRFFKRTSSAIWNTPPGNLNSSMSSRR